jgi:hypothetical protein
MRWNNIGIGGHGEGIIGDATDAIVCHTNSK